MENSNYVANKALNLESTQMETQNLQFPKESEAIYQYSEVSIVESWNEEDDMDPMQVVSSSVNRHGGWSKQRKWNQKKRKQQVKKEKLEVLLKTLKPVAFVPGKTLDFPRHEKLLKTLGLWEFLHLEFDQNIRQDLVANLVAYYSPVGKCSYVNGARINVSCPDLARALKLPKMIDIVVTEEEKEILENDESIRFVEEILSNWVLLQRDDMWIMPLEVFEWRRYIKQKQLEKLDWAALLWYMAEKELKAEPPLGDCFFASHLQLLIKTQKEDLLMERSNVNEDSAADDGDDVVKEVDFLVKSSKEECLEVMEKDVNSADSGRDDGVTDSKEEKYVEEHMIELNLGQETRAEMVSEEERDSVEGQPMDVEENKKEEDEKLSWKEDTNAGSHFLRHCNLSSAIEGDINSGSHFLRRCNLSSAIEEDEEYRIDPMEMGEDKPIEDAGKEEDKEKLDEGFPFFPNYDSLHGIAQENLMLGDSSPLGYNSKLQIHGNSTGGDFLASSVDMGSGIPSLFANGNNKRDIDHKNDNSYTDGKRLKTKEPSRDEKPPPVEICMDQILYWVEKAKMSCTEKDQERGQSAMNQQYLMQELQHKEEMIQDLLKTRYEEHHKKDLMIYKLESELRMMTSVLEGYRKVLKETKKVSREHRKRCPLLDDKPVYKNVKGYGGLVLSITEIEKLRLKQEVEDEMTRAVIGRQIEEFGSEWFKVFEDHMNAVELLYERLIEVKNEVKTGRETLLESKHHKTSETVAATEET